MIITLEKFKRNAILKLRDTSPSASLDVKLIICKVLNFTFQDIIIKNDYILSELQLNQLNALINRRSKNEPIAYIIEQKGFMNYDFWVKKGVLIPRADTELLIHKLCNLIKDKELNGLEIGVGSACISISLLKLCKKLKMRASDISDIAIEVANFNAENLNVKERLEIFKADIVDNFDTKYDFIVSNPPYIDYIDYENLMPDVKLYEPKIALYGGEDGLDYYRKILDISKKILKNKGFLAFEIGYNQAEALTKLFLEHDFKDVKVYKDLANKDRVVIGEKNDK